MRHVLISRKCISRQFVWWTNVWRPFVHVGKLEAICPVDKCPEAFCPGGQLSCGQLSCGHSGGHLSGAHLSVDICPAPICPAPICPEAKCPVDIGPSARKSVQNHILNERKIKPKTNPKRSLSCQEYRPQRSIPLGGKTNTFILALESCPSQGGHPNNRLHIAPLWRTAKEMPVQHEDGNP